MIKLGKASITIAVNAKWNGKGIEKAEAAMRRMSVLAASSSESVSSKWTKASGDVATYAGKMYNASKKVADIGDMLTRSVTVPMVAMGTYAAKAAINFDTALGNVRKTADITETQLQQLGDSALDLSTKQPVTAETILNIEALGAQLGVANGNLEDFAVTVSGLDIATDMDFETAGTQMAQFANITQMSQDKFKNYGSTIVDLGNNLATTEKDISNMALRLAGAGTAANFSQADILGMAGAMSSLGIKAEAGGSAMTRIIQDISKNVANGSDIVEEYARVAGVSADEFSNMWREKPVEAIELLVEGLKKLNDDGTDMNVTLEKLGINNVRNSDTMRRLAGAGDLLRESVNRANSAWEDNSALQTEVDKRNETLESRLQVLKNKVDEIAITVGRPLVDAVIDALNACQPLIDGVANLADKFANMDEQGQKNVLMFAGIAAATGPVLSVVGRVGEGISTVIGTFAKFGQSAGILTDALNTVDGSQMRIYASSDLLSTNIGIAGNSAAKAAGGAEKYVEAWEGMTDSAKVLGDFEGKFNKLTEAEVGASDKAAAAIAKKKDALVEEAYAARESLKANGDNVTKWSGSADEYNKATKNISGTTYALLDNEAAQRGIKASSKSASDGISKIGESAEKAAASSSTATSAFGKVKSGAGKAASGIKNFATGLIGAIGPQIAITAAIAAGTAVIGAAVDAYNKYKERQELVNGAMQSAKDIAGNAAASVGELGTAYDNLAVDNRLDDLKATNEEFAQSMEDIYTKSAKLDYVVGVIKDLAGQSGLTAGEQEKLKSAVEDYNEITGESVEVTDAENGKLSESVEALEASAKAWQYNAKQQGYAQAAAKYYQEEAEAAAQLSIAQEKLTSKKKEYDELTEKKNSKSLTLEEADQYDKLGIEIDELNGTIDDNKAAMDKAGESAEWLSNQAADMENQVKSTKSVFDEWGESVTKPFEDAGVSIDDFSEALVNAGVSTDTLHAIGSENFSALAAACNYDVDTMVTALANWNNAPMVGKNSDINVNQAQLKDAQGNLYVWNGTTLVDKDGKAIVDGTSLTDAQGNVYKWNKGRLETKHGSVTISTKSMDDSVVKWNGLSFKTKYADVIARVATQYSNAHLLRAAGGIRTHADGGIVRYHAGGGSIVNVPGSGYPLDMVGEAGAEAIVPLTNRRYAMPFVSMIADEINKGRNSGIGQTTVNNYTLTIDGVKANGNQRAMQLMEALFDEFNLTSEMGVR